MRAAIAVHDELVERAVGATGGVRPVEQGEGDSVVVAFEQARRRSLVRSSSSAGSTPLSGLRAVSFGSGWRCTPARRSCATHGNYVGPVLNRCARLRAVAHGGQTVVSRATYELVAEGLPQGASLRPLGEQRLKDLARAEEVFELAHPELPSGFPPLRSLDALPNNLPVALTSFVGRERELAEVRAAAGGRARC